MNHVYTYPVPPCRDADAKQKNNELTLFKMATICGYPGASRKCLPFYHSSFPASPTLPSLKCYSFCPKRDQTVIRVPYKKQANDCKTVMCYQERDQFDLPVISPTSTDRKSSRYVNPYVSKNKVCFRLKGINPKSVYCANRSKPNVSVPYRHSVECLRINPHRSTLLQLALSDPWNMAVETIAKATYHGADSNPERDWENREFREPSPITVAMRKRYEEERNHVTSGLKGHKGKEGRPLGHVMSPRRMNTLILEREKTFPLTGSKTEVGGCEGAKDDDKKSEQNEHLHNDPEDTKDLGTKDTEAGGDTEQTNVPKV